jgi:hypothetical protein
MCWDITSLASLSYLHLTQHSKTGQDMASTSRDMREWLHRDKVELILESDSKAYDKDSDDTEDDLTEQLVIPPQQEPQVLTQWGQLTGRWTGAPMTILQIKDLMIMMTRWHHPPHGHLVQVGTTDKWDKQ